MTLKEILWEILLTSQESDPLKGGVDIYRDTQVWFAAEESPVLFHHQIDLIEKHSYFMRRLCAKKKEASLANPLEAAETPPPGLDGKKESNEIICFNHDAYQQPQLDDMKHTLQRQWR